ncbi:hypothetical protein R3P38DRAFT_1725151 [Favolaschia claudopus]|uniref:Uncharacterized protein n=1 Tax=Favolaschia claudopus TaxID=2862362 RepID=A0AAW0AA04_9AGAR
MSFYYKPNIVYHMNGGGGPPPNVPNYQSSSVAPPRRNPLPARNMQAVVNFAVEQLVEIRLNINSPWILGIVLTVLTVGSKQLGLAYEYEYEIRYQTGNGTEVKRFSANSPDIRERQV